MVFIFQTASSQTVCIWGRHDFNGAINGAYTQRSNNYNSKTSYRKIVDSSCDTFFLYWDGNVWAISTSLGDDKLSAYAYCESSSTLTNCQNWYVWSGSDWGIDSMVSIISGACPQWDCDAITITNAPNNCDSFSIYLSDNVWRNSDSTRWWYFDPYEFAWHCSDYAPFSCGGLYWTWSDDGWTDLSKGQSMSIRLLYPSTQTRTLTCVAHPTPSPTPSPTTFPTPSPTNTQITGSPTPAPTSLPSLNPTHIPTNVPSLYPFLSQTIFPSLLPSNMPSDIPTTSPSKPSSNKPSYFPTFEPTFDDKHAEIVETAQATKYIKIKHENIKNSNNMFWIVLGILLTIIFVCIAVIVFTIRHKLKKEQKSDTIKVMSVSHINLYEGEKEKEESTHTIAIKNDSIQETNSNPTHLKQDSFIIEDDDDKYSQNTLGAPSCNINVFGSNIPMSLVSNVSPTSGVNVLLENDNEMDEELVKVREWLIGNGMGIYYDLFIENGYTSIDIIKCIESKTDLYEIGIVLKGHQTKLWVEIKKLKGIFRRDNIKSQQDEGPDTNEDITDPPTDEGDTPNDDATGSSDVNDNMNELNQKNTKGNFNELMMDDVINDINRTPQ